MPSIISLARSGGVVYLSLLRWNQHLTPSLAESHTQPPTPQVVVTGAGGRTGSLVVKKLLEQPNAFSPIATVRSKGNAGKLTSEGLPESAVVEFDLAAAAAAGAAPPGLSAALKGADALVIATSGVPQIKPLSLIPVIWAKITGKEGVRPEFTWKQGQMPEQVCVCWQLSLRK
jgi:hypothetical protein